MTRRTSAIVSSNNVIGNTRSIHAAPPHKRTPMERYFVSRERNKQGTLFYQVNHQRGKKVTPGYYFLDAEMAQDHLRTCLKMMKARRARKSARRTR